MTFQDYYNQLLEREIALKNGEKHFIDGVDAPLLDALSWTDEQKQKYNEKAKELNLEILIA